MMAVVLAAIVLAGVAIPLVSALGQLAKEPVKGENSGVPMSYGTSVPAALRGTYTVDGTKVLLDGEPVEGSWAIVTDTADIEINAAFFGVTWASGSWETYAIDGGPDYLVLDANSWAYGYSETNAASTDYQFEGRISWAYWDDADGGYVRASPAGLFADSNARVAAFCAIDDGEDLVLAIASGIGADISASAQPAGLGFDISFANDSFPLEVEGASFTLGSETEDIVSMIVPAEYVASYAETSASALIFLIPLILACALVIGVAYRFMIDRREERG